MRGRDTPSRELDEVAQYIGAEYRRLGLKPGGDRGAFIQRYSIDRVRIVAESSTAFVHGGAGATLKFGADFVFAGNGFASGDYAGDLVLVSGPLTGATADTAALGRQMTVLPSPRPRRPDPPRECNWNPAGIVLLRAAADAT